MVAEIQKDLCWKSNSYHQAHLNDFPYKSLQNESITWLESLFYLWQVIEPLNAYGKDLTRV